jgi:hypothetical protein
MDWININVNVIRGEEYIDAEPVSRATWLSLTAWCCSQENGGVIIGARSWTDRKWQQLCGVTLAEVETMCLLYGFEQDNLVVHFYPVEQEAKVIQNRINGGKGGRPKKKVAPQVPDTQGEKPCGSDSLKRKEKERKEKERKEVWDTTPQMGRTRSSMEKLGKALDKIGTTASHEQIMMGLRAWCASEDWTKEKGKWVGGIHIWVKDRKWENPPPPKKNLYDQGKSLKL